MGRLCWTGRFMGSSRNPEIRIAKEARRLWIDAEGWVGDAELVEVGFVFGWVEVEFFEVGREFLHFFFVEFDGGLVGWRKERFVADVFGLNVAEVVPCL